MLRSAVRISGIPAVTIDLCADALPLQLQAGNADSSADVERSPVAERDSESHSDRESSVDEERHSNTASQREEPSSSSDSDSDADGEDDDGTPGEAIVQSIVRLSGLSASAQVMTFSFLSSRQNRSPLRQKSRKRPQLCHRWNDCLHPGSRR
jgi:hypothetical protein